MQWNYALRLTPTIKGILERYIGVCLLCTVFSIPLSSHRLLQRQSNRICNPLPLPRRERPARACASPPPPEEREPLLTILYRCGLHRAARRKREACRRRRRKGAQHRWHQGGTTRPDLAAIRSPRAHRPRAQGRGRRGIAPKKVVCDPL